MGPLDSWGLRLIYNLIRSIRVQGPLNLRVMWSPPLCPGEDLGPGLASMEAAEAPSEAPPKRPKTLKFRKGAFRV